MSMISSSNWTEWSTIQGVIARVISKSDKREARGRFEITSTITPFIKCRAQLLNADWLRQKAFFLNQEGTFGNQEGMITWCWLAEHASIKLVSCFKRSLKRNFRNASLLSLILTRSFHLNAKENQHATKRSHLVEKHWKGFFRPKTYWFAAWKQFEWGRLTACVERSTTQNFVASKLKVNFFVYYKSP